MKKIILITLTIIISIHAEYIIVDTSQPTYMPEPKDYDAIYMTLQKYQWPMSIAYTRFLQAQANQHELSQIKQSMKEGGPHEQAIINQELQKIKPTLGTLFIPTTLYELLSLNNMLASPGDAQTIARRFIQNMITNASYFDREIYNDLARNGVTVNDITHQYARINQSPEPKRIHFLNNQYTINFLIRNNLINYLSTSVTYNDQQNSQFIQQFLTIFHREFSQHLQQNSAHINQLNLESQLESDTPLYQRLQTMRSNLVDAQKRNGIISCILKEYAAYRNNTALLYRGTDPIELYTAQKTTLKPIEIPFSIKNFTKYKPRTEEYIKKAHEQFTQKKFREKVQKITPESPLKSLSYGNSLFGGFICDPTASAYYYVFNNVNIEDEEECLGYTLPINKHDYCFGKLSDIFAIAPLSTVASLYASREAFHSRTISYDLFQDINKEEIIGFNSAFEDRLGYFKRVGSPFKHGADLSEYIAANAQIIKLPKEEGDFSPNRDYAQEYFNDQKALTKNLQAYHTLYENVGAFYKKIDILKQRAPATPQGGESVASASTQTKRARTK